MRFLTALALSICCVASPAAAGNSHAIVFAGETPRSTSTTLTQRADYVSLSLTIASEERDPEKQYEDLGNAVRTVKDAAGRSKTIIVHMGPVYFSTAVKSKMAISSSYQGNSQVLLHLLMPLSAGNDVYSRAAELERFVKSLKFPDAVKPSAGQMTIAVEDPEKYREKLIRMMSREVKKTKAAFGPGAAVSIRVDGLENPVTVRRADDEHVELFIDHTIHMDVKR